MNASEKEGNRKEGDNGNIITTIPYDTTLRVLAENDGWYKVNYNGQIGWVDGSYVNVI